MAKKKTSAAAPVRHSASFESAVHLRQIANCLAALLIESASFKEMDGTARILRLNDLGFDRNAIAALVGTTPGTVSVRLSEARAAQRSAKA